MKPYLLLLLLFLSCNNPSIQTDCLNASQFMALTKLIQTKGTTIRLQQRLVSDKELKTKELSVSNFYLELQEGQNETIIIIDKDKTIPTYTANLIEGEIYLHAYSSRFDTDKESEVRRKNWCKLANLALKQNE